MSELNDFLERMSDKYPEIMDMKRFPTTDSVLDYLDKKGELTEPVEMDLPDFADGGRVKFNTGTSAGSFGEVRTDIALPAPFIESAGKVFLTQLEKQLADTAAVDTSKFAPSVAAQNQLQQQVIRQAAEQAGLGAVTFGGPRGTVSAVDAGTGVASFEPFVAESQRLAGIDPATGQTTAAGLQAARDPFMTPFQQQVIDATKASFEQQRARDRLNIADAAVGAGAFGGARQGVQEGVYDAQTNIGLAELQANLQIQNLAQAQAERAAAMANQQGLMAAVPLAEQTLATDLQTTGTGQQALQQAIIDQNMAKARELAYEPQQRLGFFGQQFAPFTGGFGAASQFTTNTAPPPSTLNTILGVGTMAGGLLGGIGSIVSGGG